MTERRPRDIELILPDGEAVTIRVVVSPYATLLASVFEVVLGHPRGIPRSWEHYVKEKTTDLDLRPLQVLDRFFPDFLWLPPGGSRVSLEEELTAITEQDDAAILTAIRQVHPDRMPEEFEPFLRSPGEAVRTYVDTVRAYWERVFRPMWPIMASLLDGEVLRLGASLATDGPIAMLARVSYRMTYEDGALRFPVMGGSDKPIPLGHRRIVLLPMVSGPDALMSAADRDDELLLAYAAPGASAVWEVTGSPVADALGAILGGTRARVMLAVDTPATTAEVAQRLGLSPALTSHHLGKLREQQLVDVTPFGRFKYYRMTRRGAALCAAVED